MKHLLLFLVMGGITTTVFSQNSTENSNHFNLNKGIAVQGYDPVSYFKSGRAEKGNSTISSNHNGATYYFTSQENKNQFLKNPTQYEPQYGGWCAFAMGDYGKKVEINPETFKIVDGKLYLFYNAYLNNTLKSWNKDEINLKTKADNNWAKIIKN